MSRVLIFHASRHGQTARIARQVGRRLEARGHGVTLLDAPASAGAQLYLHNAFIVASPIYVGRHDRAVERVVRANVERLVRFPNAFFSVSMSAAGGGKGRRDAQRCMDEFFTRARWHPRLVASFAGELAYTRYKPWTRWLMAFISGREGGATDTSRDHEYTDWQAVDRFADEFAACLPGDRPGLTQINTAAPHSPTLAPQSDPRKEEA
jgi:menaquinone-dependent protoporphyrinogen oxidase